MGDTFYESESDIFYGWERVFPFLKQNHLSQLCFVYTPTERELGKRCSQLLIPPYTNLNHRLTLPAAPEPPTFRRLPNSRYQSSICTRRRRLRPTVPSRWVSPFSRSRSPSRSRAAVRTRPSTSTPAAALRRAPTPTSSTAAARASTRPTPPQTPPPPSSGTPGAPLLDYSP